MLPFFPVKISNDEEQEADEAADGLTGLAGLTGLRGQKCAGNLVRQHQQQQQDHHRIVSLLRRPHECFQSSLADSGQLVNVGITKSLEAAEPLLTSPSQQTVVSNH